MVNDTRTSKFFPNPLNNQLAIVHRQGTDSSMYLLGFFALVELTRIVITARRMTELEFPLFFGLVFSGFLLYLLVTISLRRFAYFSIMHGQGIYHPKFIISIPVALFANSNFIIPELTIILNFFVAITCIDLFIQNQVHDIITRIGPNTWEINSAIPVFQIPFERDFNIHPNDYNQFKLVMKVSSTGSGILPPRFQNISKNEIDKLLENENEENKYKYFALYVAKPILKSAPVDGSGLIQFYVTDDILELKEVLFEMNNLIKFEFLNN